MKREIPEIPDSARTVSHRYLSKRDQFGCGSLGRGVDLDSVAGLHHQRLVHDFTS
jgi:hypothetical protein